MQAVVQLHVVGDVEVRFDVAVADVQAAVAEHFIFGAHAVFQVFLDVAERRHAGRDVDVAGDGKAVRRRKAVAPPGADRDQPAGGRIGIDELQAAAEADPERRTLGAGVVDQVQAQRADVDVVLLVHQAVIHLRTAARRTVGKTQLEGVAREIEIELIGTGSEREEKNH